MDRDLLHLLIMATWDIQGLGRMKSGKVYSHTEENREEKAIQQTCGTWQIPP